MINKKRLIFFALCTVLIAAMSVQALDNPDQLPPLPALPSLAALPTPLAPSTPLATQAISTVQAPLAPVPSLAPLAPSDIFTPMPITPTPSSMAAPIPMASPMMAPPAQMMPAQTLSNGTPPVQTTPMQTPVSNAASQQNLVQTLGQIEISKNSDGRKTRDLNFWLNLMGMANITDENKTTIIEKVGNDMRQSLKEEGVDTAQITVIQTKYSLILDGLKTKQLPQNASAQLDKFKDELMAAKPGSTLQSGQTFTEKIQSIEKDGTPEGRKNRDKTFWTNLMSTSGISDQDKKLVIDRFWNDVYEELKLTKNDPQNAKTTHDKYLEIVALPQFTDGPEAVKQTAQLLKKKITDEAANNQQKITLSLSTFDQTIEQIDVANKADDRTARNSAFWVTLMRDKAQTNSDKKTVADRVWTDAYQELTAAGTDKDKTKLVYGKYVEIARALKSLKPGDAATQTLDTLLKHLES